MENQSSIIINQEKLNRAWELRQEANRIEESVADEYRNSVINLSQNGNDEDARVLIQELDWHESMYKFDLIRLVRTHSR